MLTRKALDNYIIKFIAEIEAYGYSPIRVILFGSYANGNPNSLSDIDLAVWDKKFSGCSSVDIEPIVSLISKFPGLELHTFSEDDTPENNPFTEEILKKGILIK